MDEFVTDKGRCTLTDGALVVEESVRSVAVRYVRGWHTDLKFQGALVGAALLLVLGAFGFPADGFRVVLVALGGGVTILAGLVVLAVPLTLAFNYLRGDLQLPLDREVPLDSVTGVEVDEFRDEVRRVDVLYDKEGASKRFGIGFSYDDSADGVVFVRVLDDRGVPVERGDR